MPPWMGLVHRVATSPIAWLLGAALVLRLLLAYGLFLGSGYKSDIDLFISWSLTLAQHGPGAFYATAGFADYPPGYLYVLWPIGSVATWVSGLLGGGTRTFGGRVYDLPQLVSGALIKLPAISADILIGYVLYRMVRRWWGDRPGGRAAAVGAAALFLFNPVTWYDSALWGQMDSVGTLVALVSLICLIDRMPEVAVAAGILASLIKPQYGIVLLPLVAVILLRRHLFAPRSGKRATPTPRDLRAWIRDEQGPLRLVSSIAVGAVLLLVLIMPFSLDVPSLITRMGSTAAGYPYLSVEAYNPWALLGSGGQPSIASGGSPSSDLLPLLGPLTGFEIGALLLGSAVLIGAVHLALDDSDLAVLLTAVFLGLAFFVLPTRVHERYLFPVFALLPLLAVRRRSYLALTVVMATAAMINLHGVLSAPENGTPDLVSLPFGAALRSPGWVIASALLVTVAFVYVACQMRPVAGLIIGLRTMLHHAPERHDDPEGFIGQ